MANNRDLRVVMLALGTALAVGVLEGQPATGRLSGQITDPSGRVIPGATVVLLKGSAPYRTTRSDVTGQYQFRNVEPGKYSVQAEARGFTRYQLADYELTGGRAQALNFSMAIAVETQQITVSDASKIEVAPENNAGALVLRGKELDALSDNPDDLAADLQALAGPAAGPNGGEIYIDGFTGGRLPPKQSIREVRINQNPFAAQFERPGQGRVEIFTKPGAEDFHGQALFQFSDAALNSRNPFVTEKPPYQRRQWEGEITGPITKGTSFFVDFEKRSIRENAFINAIVLDSSLNPVPFRDAIVTPLSGLEMNFRIDRQLTKNHTLTVRYGLNRDANDNQGVGGFSLASRAYNVRDNEDTWQATETGVLNARTVNETRFRYRRQHTSDTAAATGPTINVLDSFTGGGPPVSLAFNDQNRYELQNFTSTIRGAHTIRWGGLMRAVALSDQATQNYPGTFTFTSLEAYRLTVMGPQNGMTSAQIRAGGGGPSQFSMAGGNPLADVTQVDFGIFAQDDWKARRNLTLSGGLRYETQTHSSDRSDIAPRLGFAWAPGKSAKAPKWVIRGGFGIFYERINESLTLSALRQDGVRQQQFLVPFPDFYPTVPSVQSLAHSAQPQAIRKTDAAWRSPMMLQAAIGFERQLPKNITVSTTYLHTRGVHALRSRNINAPYPGIGVGPFGGVNSIYLYESSGVYRQNQILTNVNARINPKITLTGSYALGYANSNTDGAGSFPANQYDLSSEYGRAGFDTRHRVQLNGSVLLPFGLRISPFLTISSGRPYSITTGTDWNGDSLYNDRPGFAENPGRPSVVHTALGAFDLAPLPGQKMIPRNSAEGPGFVGANVRVGKTFSFGEKDRNGKKQSGDPKQLTFSVNARNLINHPNLASPNGNLSSPLFGTSTALTGGGQGSVRRLDLQLRFDF
jgi:hypothetical protein